MKDDFKKEPKMHAQLLTHDNHASGLGGEHSEDSLENHMTFTVDFFTYYPITLHVSVKPEINYVIILSRTVLRKHSLGLLILTFISLWLVS